MENELITFDSTPFKKSREELDKAIQNILNQVYSKNFESGDITLKISVEVLEGELELDFRDSYPYKSPLIESTITTSLKKTGKSKTQFISQDVELKQDSDGYVLKRLPKAQITMDDIYIMKEEGDE